jgi:hypothetical protein
MTWSYLIHQLNIIGIIELIVVDNGSLPGNVFLTMVFCQEYLVDCIKNLKAELTATSAQLQLAREQLAGQEQQLQETSRQLELTVQQQQETRSSLSQQLVQAVHQEKERGSQAMAELQER